MIAKDANKNVSKNVSKNISKSIKTLTAALLTTMAPFSVSQAQSVFDCFYVGAGIGESVTNSRLNSQFSAGTIGDGTILSTRASSSQYLNRDTVFGDIYAGYGYTFCPYYLGGEISLKIWDPNSTNNSALTTIDPVVTSTLVDSPSLRFNKLEFDLDLRPGFLLSDCSLLYGRIGIAFNKISLNSVSTSTPILTIGGETITFPNSLAVSTNKTVVGLRLGLGIEQMICDCISLRLDYVGTQFNRINLDTNQSRTFDIDDDTITSSFSASRNLRVIDHTFMLGLSYYW